MLPFPSISWDNSRKNPRIFRRLVVPSSGNRKFNLSKKIIYNISSFLTIYQPAFYPSRIFITSPLSRLPFSTFCFSVLSSFLPFLPSSPLLWKQISLKTCCYRRTTITNVSHAIYYVFLCFSGCQYLLWLKGNIYTHINFHNVTEYVKIGHDLYVFRCSSNRYIQINTSSLRNQQKRAFLFPISQNNALYHILYCHVLGVTCS